MIDIYHQYLDIQYWMHKSILDYQYEKIRKKEKNPDISRLYQDFLNMIIDFY